MTTGDNKTLDDNLAALSEILEQMELGKLTLEESLNKFEHGVHLVNECRQMIDAAEKKIQILEAKNEQI